MHEEFLDPDAGPGAVEPDEEVLEDGDRLRRRRQVPGPGEVRPAVLDGVEGRDLAGARVEATDETRPMTDDTMPTTPTSPRWTSRRHLHRDQGRRHRGDEGRRRPRARDQRRRPRPGLRRAPRRRQQRRARHDPDVRGLPADRRDHRPDQRRRSRAWSTTSRSTGCGCRRGARTRSPTTAARCSAPSASTSPPLGGGGGCGGCAGRCGRGEPETPTLTVPRAPCPAGPVVRQLLHPARLPGAGRPRRPPRRPAPDGARAEAALPFSARCTTDRRPPRTSGGRPMPRSGGVSCSCARAGSPLPRERRTSPWSRRSGSGTCRGGPRPAVRASSGSPGDATTRHAAPTRPRRTTRTASWSPSSGGSRRSSAVGTGGAVDAVLADPRLRGLAERRTEPWLAVPDPRRQVLDQAIADARSVSIAVTDPND